MLRVNDKKIDTAFGRLRKRRTAVGLSSTAESTEDETERIRQAIAAAQATGDIATIIKLVTSTSKLTTTDFIQKTCGSLLFLYYTYVDKFKQLPVDIDDMVDGLLYFDAKNYIIKEARIEGTKK